MVRWICHLQFVVLYNTSLYHENYKKIFRDYFMQDFNQNWYQWKQDSHYYFFLFGNIIILKSQLSISHDVTQSLYFIQKF